MRLSSLQKYILLECLNFKTGRIPRARLKLFYKNQEIDSKTKIITKSIERLINREFLVGYGVRTPHKWFIKEIRLTVKGKKLAFKLQGEQMKLPFAVELRFKNNKRLSIK